MLDKIVFFVYVVRFGSFSEAAKEYGISASAGSRWILELEEKMGVSLLKRSTRQVVPTQAGVKLYDRFSEVHLEIEEICSEIQSLSNEEQGTVKIASTPLFATRYLHRIVGEYMKSHPKVNFRLYVNPYEVDHISTVDFAIRASASYQGYVEKDSLLVKRALLSEPLHLCCTPDYLLEHQEPGHPKDLKNHRCLYASTLVGGNKWVFQQGDEFSQVVIPDALECDNSEILRGVALQGAGIAYLPYSLIKGDLEQGRFVSLLQQYMASTFDLNLYYRPRKQMPARCRNFKDYLLMRVEEISLESKQAELV